MTPANWYIAFWILMGLSYLGIQTALLYYFVTLPILRALGH